MSPAVWRVGRIALVGICVLHATAACHRSRVLSPYGSRSAVSRRDDGFVVKRERLHSGVDFRVDLNGGPALAAADGTVDLIEFDGDAGFMISVGHPGTRYWTRYVHLRSAAVRVGERVRRGQVLGEVGVFKNSGGVMHVHFQLCRTVTCHGSGEMGSTEDPLSRTVGCFDPERVYPDLELVLTYPVRCD